MKKIEFTKKALRQAIVVTVGVAAIAVLAVSQRTGIGQAYQSVTVNGQVIGYTSANTDVQKTIKAARRELALESEERLCMDYEWTTEKERELFQTLLSEEELKDLLKETLKETVIHNKQKVYTVAIEDYRANFATLSDVLTFLDKVKAPVDEAGEYKTEVYRDFAHISGILHATLTKVQTQEKKPDQEVLPERTLADGTLAGVSSEMIYAMEYAAVNPPDEIYRTGLLGLEFIEEVQVYENYVEPGELSDIEEEIIEVTKEKESNKIYVVESGDCVSVIAMDHDTTVSSIVALNGLKNADAIREGQELIIAVPEPDLKLRVTRGEVYEEDYNADPVIIENDGWYTTKEVIHEEGTVGHRERNDVVVYENGIETDRQMIHENVMTESKAAVIERGTIIPPTYIKPLSGGRFTSGYGRRWGRLHKGIDWACPVGTTIYASCGGTVIQASYNGGYGKNVVISHPDGRMTRYAHNSKLLVQVGQKVEQGEAIALSGNTGRSTGPHVHFEIYVNGVAVNPLKYISN